MMVFGYWIKYFIQDMWVVCHSSVCDVSSRRRIHEGRVWGHGFSSSGDPAQLSGAESLGIVRAERHELTGSCRGRSHVRAGRHGHPAGRERPLARHHDHTAFSQMMSPALGGERSEGWGQILPVVFFSSPWSSLTLSRSSGPELAQRIFGGQKQLWRTKELPVHYAIDYGGAGLRSSSIFSLKNPY